MKLEIIDAPNERKFAKVTIFETTFSSEVLISPSEISDGLGLIKQIYRQMQNYELDELSLFTLLQSIISKWVKGVNPRQLFHSWHNFKQSMMIDKYLFERAYLGLYQ